jgi:hypothetical protein
MHASIAVGCITAGIAAAADEPRSRGANACTAAAGRGTSAGAAGDSGDVATFAACAPPLINAHTSRALKQPRLMFQPAGAPAIRRSRSVPSLRACRSPYKASDIDVANGM